MNMRSTLALAALVASLPLGCLPSTNPCDPETPLEMQARLNLSGTVVDQDGEPLPEVTVAVDETGQTATSNAEGQFTLTELPSSTAYTLTAYPESPAVGGSITVDNLACNEQRFDLELPVVVPPDSPEVEITAATAADRILVAFPSVLPESTEDGETVEAPYVDVSSTACSEELDAEGIENRYWLEVRAPFGVWRPALLNPDPIASKHAHDGFDIDKAFRSLGEGCMRATCGFYTYQFDVLDERKNARCTEVVGYIDDNGDRQRLDRYETYQVRVRADELVATDSSKGDGLPSAVTSVPSSAPDRLSLVPTVMMHVPMASEAESDEAMRNDLDISKIVPVADGRFALIDSGGLKVVGAGSAEAQFAAGIEADDAASASANSASVEGGMFFDDVTSESTDAEVTAANATAVDVLPAGKWVRVLKRQASGASMIDKVWVGDSWGTNPANSSPAQPVFDMDPTSQGLPTNFLGLRWLGGLEGDATDPDAPYNPPDAYLLLFGDGVAMFEAVDQTSGNDDVETYMDTMAAMDDGDGNLDWLDVRDPVIPGQTGSMCDGMGEAMGSYTESGAGLSAFGACFDMKARFENIQLSDVGVLKTRKEAFLLDETVHLFADRVGDRVAVVQSSHLMAKDLPAGVTGPSDIITPVQVGVEPVAMQPSVILDCTEDGEDPVPVMLVANRGSLDISVVKTVDYGEGANPRFSAEEYEVVQLPMVPTGFFGDLGVPTCADPFSWVVGEAGEMMPIDMRTRSLPECKEGPCSVTTRSRARAGAISRDEEGHSRILIGGQGVLSEVGYLLPSPSSSFAREPETAPGDDVDND